MKIKNNVKCFISMIAIILYPSMFMYFHNMSEGHFIEILPSIGKNLILAVVLLVAFSVLFRNIRKAFLTSEIALLLFMNFNTILGAIKKIIPGMRKAYFFVIVAVILTIVFSVVKRKINEPENICTILGIVFFVLIVFNLISSIPQILTNNNKTAVSQEENDIAEKRFTGDKPNVYFFLFDEYAGFENIEHYYDYDNQEFSDFLTQRGFNISYGSHNTETIWTSTIVPNILNLSYVASDDIYSIDNMARSENAYLYQLFANNGYQINMVNHLNTFSDTNCNVLNYKQKKENLSTYVLDNGIWSEVDSFVSWGKQKLSGNSNDYYTNLSDVLTIMENITDYTSDSKPTFTFAYAECPHEYFTFDADGNRIAKEDETNWKDKSIYLNQYKYITKCMERIVEDIQKNDPDALIILMSDHGARYPHWQVDHYGAKAYDASVETLYMQNILNCFYYKGEKLDIEGMTSINTWRTVLNTYFGTDYEMLPAPEGFKASTGF